MPLYLSTYVGKGEYEDPFVPKHVTDRGWASADIRPDPTLVDGFNILYSPVVLAGAPDLIPIADQPGDSLSLGSRNLLYNALGENFGGRNNKIDSVLGDLLFVPRSKWSEVSPSTIRSVKEIEFQGVVWAKESVERVRAEEMDPTDNFTRSNEDPLAGNWSQVPGSSQTLRIVSNLLSHAAADGFAAYRWNADAFSADQFSEVTVATLGVTSDFHVCGRCSSGALTLYMAAALDWDEQIIKIVAGASTKLASVTSANVVVSDVLKLECEGATQRWILNGSLKGSTTDSSIASGNAGMAIYSAGSQFSAWTGANMTSVVPVFKSQYRRRWE